MHAALAMSYMFVFSCLLCTVYVIPIAVIKLILAFSYHATLLPFGSAMPEHVHVG